VDLNALQGARPTLREARRLSGEHQRIESLYGGVSDAIAQGEGDKARTRFALYSEALLEHMAAEDERYFPALLRLDPALASELKNLAHEHTRLQEDLRDVRKRIEIGELDAAAARFDALATSIAKHDAREEDMLERIRASLPTAVQRREPH